MPLLYVNEREKRELKGNTIDEGVVRDVREIENRVYRKQQKLLQKCGDYEDIAEIYGMDRERIQVEISREKDWYIIYEEREKEAYIADLAMVNGVNAEGKGEKGSETIHQTLEITESVYSLMLNMASQGKNIRFEATEDTSYINIRKMAEKGLITIEEEHEEKWRNNKDDEDYEYEDYEEETTEKIKMHNMVVKANKEKLEEELKRIKKILKKRQERRTFDKVDDEDR